MPAVAIGLTVLPALPGASNDNAILGPKHWGNAKMEMAAAKAAREYGPPRPLRLGLGGIVAGVAFAYNAKEYYDTIQSVLEIGSPERGPAMFWTRSCSTSTCPSDCYTDNFMHNVSATLCNTTVQNTFGQGLTPPGAMHNGNSMSGWRFLPRLDGRWDRKSVVNFSLKPGVSLPVPSIAYRPALDPAYDPVIEVETAPGRPQLNPNRVRVSPSPKPAVAPQPSTGAEPGVNPFTGEATYPQPLPNLRWEMQVGPNTVPPLAPRHTPKRPPDKNTQEKKKKTGGAAAAALFAALDKVSEAAEVVDAIFEALPKDVQSAYKQKGRGLVDQAGQYGIDGADWKAVAIWDNFDKVDWDQAFKNVIANEIQDQALGNIHKHMPKNTGSAVDSGFKGVNQGIEGVLGAFGL